MTIPDDIAALVPFVATLGIRLESATADEVVATLPYAESLTTLGGALNGGALMSLADNAGGVCAHLNLPPGARTSTTNSATTFLRGARSDVTAVSRPLHVGRTTIAVVTEIRDVEGRLVAQTTQSQAVLVPT